MRRIPCRQAAISLVLLLALPVVSLGAASEDFYRSLLRRGIARFDAGDHDGASKLLRIAAFGLIGSVDEYETAHVYLAIAHDGMKRESDARASAQRVLAGERITRRYASLPIPQPVRARFEAVVKKVLNPEQLAALRGGTLPTPPTSSTIVRRNTSTPPAATNGPTKPPERATTTPTPAPRTTPATPPATPRPPAPQPVAAVPVQPSNPAPMPPVPRRVVDVNAELDRGDSALAGRDLAGARGVFRALHGMQNLTHSQRIRIAEGLTRARDFDGAVQAFTRLTAFRTGEEPYRYYYAIALYETGDYRSAKRELEAALPHIEATPDVARYRTKIDASVN